MRETFVPHDERRTGWAIQTEFINVCITVLHIPLTVFLITYAKDLTSLLQSGWERYKADIEGYI